MRRLLASLASIRTALLCLLVALSTGRALANVGRSHATKESVMKAVLQPSVALSSAAAATACANPGDIVASVSLQNGGNGVSVAADCRGIVYYTNATATGNTILYMTNTSGTTLASVTTTDPSGQPFEINEMAWDCTRNVLWAVGRPPGPGQPFPVYWLDPSSGTTTFQFSVPLNGGATGCCLMDGIAYDCNDDTLWFSPDGGTVVSHYTTLGVPINTITPLNSGGTAIGNIAGIEVDAFGNMYVVQVFPSASVFKVSKATGAFVGTLVGPLTFPEGLEIDAVSYSPMTVLWVREHTSLTAVELVPDSRCCCGSIACSVASGECCAGRPDFDAPAYASFGSLVSVGTASPQAVGSAVVAVFDLVNPNGGPFNANFGAPIYTDPSWSEGNLGSVFGVTLDPLGNIYVASTTCYNLDAIGTLGGATFGKVYKINRNTSVASLFVTIPNTGPQLGNICYDCEHRQFFVSNMDDGKIYRVNTGGTILNAYDFGVPDVPSNSFAPLGDRIWAVQEHDGRLYFSVWWEDAGNPSATRANEIWSIALNVSGNFTGAPQLEISMSPFSGNYSNPVSDMRFTPTGTMLVAERGMVDGTTPTPHQARLLEFECVNGVWTPSTTHTFSVGVVSPGANSAGGVDMDYGVGGRVYGTGDALQLGSPDQIYGTQGLPATGGTVANSILVDYNGNLTVQDKTEIGDVAIPCRPCLPPPPNMALWLPFDETSGGAGAVTANLISAAGNGTLAGAASLGPAGEVVRSVCFDQGQVNVMHYSSIYLDNDFTIDAWIRPSPQASSTWKYTIVDKRQFVGASWRGFWMYLDGSAGTLTLEFSDLGAVNTATGPAVPLNSLWQHVAVTLDRNCGGAGNVCVDFWLDGVQWTTTSNFTGVTGTIGNNAQLRVGDDLPSNTDKWFLGCIDELEIFGRALTHAEILRIYAAFEEGKCKSGPSVMDQNCFPGEAGVIACPCANPPAGGGYGCDNFGAGPAQSGTLTATGVASLSADTVLLLATGENNTSLTVFWTGLNPKSATGVAHGAGVRCVTSQLRRLYTHSASGGAVSAPAGADLSVSARTAQVYGTAIGPGETRKYFTIYRDPQAAGPCGATSSTVNLTNSGGITWEP